MYFSYLKVNEKIANKIEIMTACFFLKTMCCAYAHLAALSMILDGSPGILNLKMDLLR